MAARPTAPGISSMRRCALIALAASIASRSRRDRLAKGSGSDCSICFCISESSASHLSGQTHRQARAAQLLATLYFTPGTTSSSGDAQAREQVSPAQNMPACNSTCKRWVGSACTSTSYLVVCWVGSACTGCAPIQFACSGRGTVFVIWKFGGKADNRVKSICRNINFCVGRTIGINYTEALTTEN